MLSYEKIKFIKSTNLQHLKTFIDEVSDFDSLNTIIKGNFCQVLKVMNIKKNCAHFVPPIFTPPCCKTWKLQASGFSQLLPPRYVPSRYCKEVSQINILSSAQRGAPPSMHGTIWKEGNVPEKPSGFDPIGAAQTRGPSVIKRLGDMPDGPRRARLTGDPRTYK